jgi:hypothetical protein
MRVFNFRDGAAGKILKNHHAGCIQTSFAAIAGERRPPTLAQFIAGAEKYAVVRRN